VKKSDTKEWLAKIEEWKKKGPLSYKKDDLLHPQYVVEEFTDKLKEKPL